MPASATCEYCNGTGIQRLRIEGEMRDHGECPCVAEGNDEMSYCYFHYEIEDIPPRVYRICGECGHVYPEEINLQLVYMSQYNQIARQEGSPILEEPPTGEEIFFCQYCIHDF